MSNHKYDDIIHLEHHVSKNHPQMSRTGRAAQFAPFAALTGYEEAVIETARLTDARLEDDEERLGLLDTKMQILMDQIETHPLVSFVIFEKDPYKAGGHYVEISGRVRTIDEFNQVIKLENKQNIPMGEIMSMDSTVFDQILDIMK